MRIAFISDIHANITALNAVLADIEAQRADRVIFLGDAATIGSHPNEVLTILRQLECVCILGNHDEAMLFPERATDLQIVSTLHSALDWGVARLSDMDFKFLRSFVPTYEFKQVQCPSILCFHGSPLSNIDSVLATTAPEALDKFFEGQTASIWIGGHTHIQLMRRYGNNLLINPGSVGNAFHHSFIAGGKTPALLPWAEYAIISMDGNSVSADMRRVPFDTQETLRLMVESKNPSAPWWLQQYK